MIVLIDSEINKSINSDLTGSEMDTSSTNSHENREKGPQRVAEGGGSETKAQVV